MNPAPSPWRADRSFGRRRWLRSAASLAGATLAGCGFTLRGALPMPFRSIALVGFAPQSPLERALRAQLALGAEVTPHPGRAQVVLQALRDARERVVVASTAAGQVRELQLRARLSWRASTPTGRELITPNEVVLARDMSWNEAAALAKEKEAELLYVAMDEDIASQVMQRLTRLKMS
jgi:LPS-assembly lipoprotein